MIINKIKDINKINLLIYRIYLVFWRKKMETKKFQTKNRIY